MSDSMTRMTQTECAARLAAGSVGRVAVTAHALPVVIPVNYTVDAGAVVFRTRPDGMLARACDGTVVAFEVDDIATDGEGGWSVLVVGVARLLAGGEALRALQLNLVSAMGPGRDQFVRIEPGRVTGRRIGSEAVADHFPLQVSVPSELFDVS